MAKLNVAEELDAAIRSAARDFPEGGSSREIAEAFYESHRQLIEPFIPEWTIEKLTSLVGRDRARARAENREQQPLFIAERALGIGRLPQKVKRKDGTPVPRGEATVGPFRALVRELEAKGSPALNSAKEAVALFAEHSPNDQRITWAEVAELQAAKKAKQAKKAGKDQK